MELNWIINCGLGRQAKADDYGMDWELLASLGHSLEVELIVAVCYSFSMDSNWIWKVSQYWDELDQRGGETPDTLPSWVGVPILTEIQPGAGSRMRRRPYLLSELPS